MKQWYKKKHHCKMKYAVLEKLPYLSRRKNQIRSILLSVFSSHYNKFELKLLLIYYLLKSIYKPTFTHYCIGKNFQI